MTKFSSRRIKKHQINSTQHERNRGSHKTNKNSSIPKKLTKNIEQEDIKSDRILNSNTSIENLNSDLHSPKQSSFSNEQNEQVNEENIPQFSSFDQQIQDNFTDENTRLELDVEETNCNVSFDKKFLQKILQNYQQKKYLECISQLEEILKSKPIDLEYVYWLGMCYYQLRQLKKAAKYFVQASYRVETEELFYVESFFWLGEIYRQQKELKRARENYQKFLALAPKSVYSPTALKYLSKIKLELMFDL